MLNIFPDASMRNPRQFLIEILYPEFFNKFPTLVVFHFMFYSFFERLFVQL